MENAISFKDLMRQKTDRRVKDLCSLDMRFNGDSFVGKESDNSDFNMHHTEISCDSDEQWNEKIAKMRAELERRRK